MTAVLVLAGGLGTRLRGAVPYLPKPMAEVSGRPFLEHLMDYWILQGASKFILSVGYKKNLIINHFGSTYKGISVVYVEENEPLGTGGGLVLAAQGLTEPFVLLNGDTYFEASLEELLNFHRTWNCDWTIALFRANESDRYGEVSCNEGGRITKLDTKKSQIGGLANGGVYLIEPKSIFSSKFKAGQAYSLEDQILPSLISGHKTIMGLEQAAKFLDIGIPADYFLAEKIIS